MKINVSKIGNTVGNTVLARSACLTLHRLILLSAYRVHIVRTVLKGEVSFNTVQRGFTNLLKISTKLNFLFSPAYRGYQYFSSEVL